MRMNLAVLDWVRLLHVWHHSHLNMCHYMQNENVSRETTSERMYEDLRRPTNEHLSESWWPKPSILCRLFGQVRAEKHHRYSVSYASQVFEASF